MKTGSSKWLKTQSQLYADFHWQSGYGMFAISPSHRDSVEKYIDGQKEHHHHVTFQDEYRRLLQKYDVPFDEKYVWD